MSSSTAVSAKRSLRFLLNSVLLIASVGYPFLVWFSLDKLQPRFLALLLAALLLLRLLSRNRSGSRGEFWLAIGGVGLLLAVALVNRGDGLLIYPVFVSLSFFAVFAYSLLFPPTVIERLARLEFPDLPPQGVAYTRKVTAIWSVFFLFNAALSTATVWYGDYWLWSLYNGCIFYVLMGLLMAVEMTIRRRVKAKF